MRNGCAPTEPLKSDRAAEKAGEETETAHLAEEEKTTSGGRSGTRSARGNHVKETLS